MPATTSRESTPEVCARLKDLGYASQKRVKLYGEELELVSDPFIHEGRFAIRACSRRKPTERVVFIPKTIVETARQARRSAS
jgi:hypothetical protein